MKRVVTVLVFGLVLAAAGVVLWQERGSEISRTADALSPIDESAQVLGVETFMRNVDRYPGTVRVEGVVSAVAATEQVLTLIDLTELERCGVVTCAPLSLPVRWNGPMPSVRDIVQLAGRVQDEQGKLLFLASALQKVDQPETEPSP